MRLMPLQVTRLPVTGVFRGPGYTGIALELHRGCTAAPYSVQPWWQGQCRMYACNYPLTGLFRYVTRP